MGAGVAAVCGLAGCGGAARPAQHRRPSGAVGDAWLLNALLAAEYHAIAAYTAAAPLLSGAPANLARQFLGQEVLHTDRLIQLIQRAGGQPGQAQASYDLGHPQGQTQLMQLLLDVERLQLTAYLQVVPLLVSGALRSSAASILSNQAQHAALWRLRLGQQPAPSALVTGRD